ARNAKRARSGVIRQWVQAGGGEEFQGNRIGDAVGRNDVSGERISGERIFDRLIRLVEEVREIASAPRSRCHARSRGAGSALLGAFVIEKEERLVADHRAAQSAAEDVAAEGRAGRLRAVVEEAVGIELIVAQKFEHVSM